MAPDTMQKCFQLALVVEDKIKRRGEQNNRERGGINFRGTGGFGGKNTPFKMVILTSKSPMESSITRMEDLEKEEGHLEGVGKETKAEDLVFS